MMNKIETRDVNFWYGDFHALKGISMDIAEKSVVAFIGPSGCGKSTFLRLLNRMNDLIPDTRLTGEILIDGQDIYKKGVQVDELRKNVGMVFQRPNPFPKSIFENVAYGLRVNGVTDNAFIRRRVEETLKGAALWDEVKDKLKVSAYALSGGQRQRVGIAQALLGDPEILVLDEPTAGLDPEERIRFRGIISDLSQQKLVLLSTHIVSDLEAVANEIILLRKGVVLEMQKPASLLDRLNGQVWLVTVPAADEAALTKQYTCSNVMHTDGKSVIRLLSESAPRPDAVPTAPNMEDLYLYYFGR